MTPATTGPLSMPTRTARGWPSGSRCRGTSSRTARARGDYDTIGGLVMAELGRLPEPGDVVTVPLPAPSGDEGTGDSAVDMTVCSVQRRVPDLLQLRPTALVPAGHEKERS